MVMVIAKIFITMVGYGNHNHNHITISGYFQLWPQIDIEWSVITGNDFKSLYETAKFIRKVYFLLNILNVTW